MNAIADDSLHLISQSWPDWNNIIESIHSIDGAATRLQSSKSQVEKDEVVPTNDSRGEVDSAGRYWVEREFSVDRQGRSKV